MMYDYRPLVIAYLRFLLFCDDLACWRTWEYIQRMPELKETEIQNCLN